MAAVRAELLSRAGCAEPDIKLQLGRLRAIAVRDALIEQKVIKASDGRLN